MALYGYLYSYNFIAALLGGIVFFASKFWIALVVNVIATGLLVLIALIIIFC